LQGEIVEKSYNNSVTIQVISNFADFLKINKITKHSITNNKKIEHAIEKVLIKFKILKSYNANDPIFFAKYFKNKINMKLFFYEMQPWELIIYCIKKIDKTKPKNVQIVESLSIQFSKFVAQNR